MQGAQQRLLHAGGAAHRLRVPNPFPGTPQVRRAYKRLALQLHPDKVAQAQGGRGGGSGGGGGAAEAEARRERFLRVAAAYRLLSGSAG